MLRLGRGGVGEEETGEREGASRDPPTHTPPLYGKGGRGVKLLGPSFLNVDVLATLCFIFNGLGSNKF